MEGMHITPEIHLGRCLGRLLIILDYVNMHETVVRVLCVNVQ